MHPVALTAALLLLAPLAETAPAQRTITKAEIRRDSPHRTHLRLRDTIWDMFEQRDMRSRTAPRFRLGDVSLSTRPRGTPVPSLCRYESVSFEFAPAGPEAGAGTEVEAVGIEAQPYFHFTSPPAGSYDIVVRDGVQLTEGRCRSVRIDQTSFFSASGPELATNAYRAFLNLQHSLRDGRPVALECNLFPRETDSCKDIILRLGQDDILIVEECDTLGGCFAVHAGDRKVSIIVEDDRDLKVMSAKLASMLIFAHSRID
jgi:hypothetical protein